MTNAQMVISRYINSYLERDILSVKMVDDTTVKVIDKSYNSISLTVNIYCDIMESDTKKVIAISNLPHDLSKINMNTIPTSWIKV